MMRLSDYVAQKIVDSGIRHVFMVTGGGAMHLDDSLGKNPGLHYVCNHHEQACAMAAESYARLTGNIALVCVTSGPGGTNAITGVLGGWLDSIPMLVISGQVRYDTTVRSTGLNLRQLGDQEYDIVKSVSAMTKYAVMVTEPNEIRYHIERALYLSKAGRPGPCWIDIPLSVQGSKIDENNLKPYDPSEDSDQLPPVVSKETALKIINKIKRSRRPVLLAGSAIRLAGAHEDFLRLVDALNVPVVTAWNAHDNIHDDHRLYFGRPSSIGDRAGNFIVQNSDLLLVLGCRLNVRQIGYNWKSFAREAFKIVVEIDPLELRKPTIKPDMAIQADVGDFIGALLEGATGTSPEALPRGGLPEKKEWLDWCGVRRRSYPVVLKEYWERKELVNPYCFIEALGKRLPEGQVMVTGNGSACVCAFQAAYIRKGQRLYTNSGSASMGYDLPAAIGACYGSGMQKIVCIAGDGSLQMNIQELQTIVHNKLPIKIFVLNNGGYHSVRQTQSNFFGLPLVGCDPQSGVSFPDMERIAYAYGIPFFRCSGHAELDDSIRAVMDGNHPSVCEVMLTPDQAFAPKQSSRSLPSGKIVSMPLEDLAPFLEREEFRKNMIIEPLEEE